MLQKTLYLAPLIVVAASWIAFVSFFATRRRQSAEATASRGRSSILGIVLVMLGFAVVWSMARRPFTPLVPLGIGAQVILGVIACALAVAAAWIVRAAARTLGAQWSLQARLRDDHVLITTGPYRWMRHPIYAGLFAFMLAAGLAYSNWKGLLLGAVFSGAGTFIRVRAEVRLLHAQFPQAYDEYARRVPAIIPWPTRTT